MIYEIVSAILCFILVKFMIKPYQLTGKKSYISLPLGFFFLGISSVIAAIAYSPLDLGSKFLYLPLLTRTYSFVFLAISYFFSNRFSKKGQLFADLTVSLLFVILAIFLILTFVAPDFALTSYSEANAYLRIISIASLCYIVIYTLRSHVRNPDPTTIWIPFGFVFLAISQYSLLFWYIDSSYSAFLGSLLTRWIGLTFFLFVAYHTFYTSSDKKDG